MLPFVKWALVWPVLTCPWISLSLTHTHTDTHIHTQTHTHIHTHAETHRHTHTDTHTQTHTHLPFSLASTWAYVIWKVDHLLRSTLFSFPIPYEFSHYSFSGKHSLFPSRAKKKKKKSLPNLVSSVHQFLSSVWSLLTPNIGYESPFTDRKTKNPLTFFLWFSGPFLPSNSPGPCAMFQTQGSLWRAPGSPLCRLTALLQRPPASSAAARPYTQPPLLAGPSDPFSFSIPTLFQRILLVALLSLCV